jgi:two-component system response regulator GlrR
MNESALAAETTRQRAAAQRQPSDVARLKLAMAMVLAPQAEEADILAMVDPIARKDSAEPEVRAMASFLQGIATERRRLKESAATAGARLRDERRARETEKQRAEAMQERAAAAATKARCPHGPRKKPLRPTEPPSLMSRNGKASLLLVDDDPDLLRLLSIRLKANNYDVTAVDSGPRALAAIAASRPDLVLTDLRMEGMDGMALFREIQVAHSGLPVIILTAHGTIPDAVQAVKDGVFGYLTKPYDAGELLMHIERALTLHSGGTGRPEGPGHIWREDIVTRSSLMEDLLGKAQRVANGDASILIQGESGTGKELLARAIHRASPRLQPPVRRRSTAARSRDAPRKRALRPYQGILHRRHRRPARPLRRGGQGHALPRRDRRHAARPPGEAASRDRDARGAAHRLDPLDPLRRAHHLRDTPRPGAREGRGHFPRGSLLPPERRHAEAPVPRRAARGHRAPRASFPREARAALRARAGIVLDDALELLGKAKWPGNVRQLYNVVEQSIALCPTEVIPRAFVEQAIQVEMHEMTSFEDARKRFERDYLTRILKLTHGSVTQAAKLARRNRTEFYKLLQRHGIEAAIFKSEATK